MNPSRIRMRRHHPHVDGTGLMVCSLRSARCGQSETGRGRPWMIVSAAPAEECNCEYVSKASNREQPVVRAPGVAAGNLGQPGCYEGENKHRASCRRRL